MNAGPLPAGARVASLTLHQDARGSLVAFDRDTLPFEPARTFVIFDVPPGARRAARPAACDEFLWTASGACRVTFSDVAETTAIVMDTPHRGLFIPAGTTITLDDFAPGTLLVVLAAKSFAETERGPRHPAA